MLAYRLDLLIKDMLHGCQMYKQLIRALVCFIPTSIIYLIPLNCSNLFSYISEHPPQYSIRNTQYSIIECQCGLKAAKRNNIFIVSFSVSLLQFFSIRYFFSSRFFENMFFFRYTVSDPWLQHKIQPDWTIMLILGLCYVIQMEITD